jgi:hypothetical protein
MRATVRTCAAVVMTALVLSGTGQVGLRADVQGPGEKGGPPAIPLKVTVQISRFDGEKRTASLPFTLWVNTGGQGSIRMSSEVPVPTTTVQEGKAVSSYTYRPLGTNIDCSANALDGGLFRLSMSVEDSQVFRAAGVQAQIEGLRPTFQTFRAQLQPILRDGQQVQFAVATDKTSGEVIKLDVTLNLVK